MGIEMTQSRLGWLFTSMSVVVVLQRIPMAIDNVLLGHGRIRLECGDIGRELLLGCHHRGEAIAQLRGSLANAGCLGFDVSTDFLFGFARERARNGFARCVHTQRRALLADRDALCAYLDELLAIIE